MENKRLPYLCDDKTCTGCLACVNACGKHALVMTKNVEGFYRPHLEEDFCIMCGRCERVCPVITPAKKHEDGVLKVFAAWHRDDAVRAKSSSGGAFSALASAVLKKGGIVFGAAYSDDMTIKHIGIEDENDLDQLRLSKYAQSCIGDSFTRVKSLLEDGRLVMFVGTPCQVAGLRNYLLRDYENLILVDFICHGVASIEMLQKYLNWLGKDYGRVTHINFRDKRKGWYDSLRVIKNENGNEFVMRGAKDNYWVAYSNNNNLQESCYHCVSQGFPRCSDITIADFWRIGHVIPFGHKDEIEKGISLIAVNNPRAAYVVEDAAADLYMEIRYIEETLVGNKAAIKSSVRPRSRDTFYEDLRMMDYDAFRNKYMSSSLKQKAVKLFREYLPSSIVKFVRLKNQK